MVLECSFIMYMVALTLFPLHSLFHEEPRCMFIPKSLLSTQTAFALVDSLPSLLSAKLTCFKCVQIFIQTGYPLDLPSGSLGSYCIYEYHMVRMVNDSFVLALSTPYGKL